MGRLLPRMPRTVWLLGWVSLATDTATEAIYPILPFFLTQVLGAGALSLGVIEGAAEAVNSVLKIWSGRLTDSAKRRGPLVLAGYAISSAARPLIALAQAWPHVLAVRVLDRVGKGIRSAPRDALLADHATPETRGRIFGFHRAMDHTGAIIGPVLATLFLLAYPGRYRTLFALAIVPGAMAVALLLLVREDESPRALASGAPRDGRDSAAGPAKVAAGASVALAHVPLPPDLTRFFLILTVFTLGNSTDAFLLLRLTDVMGSAAYVPLLWAALHVVKAASSVTGGAWSDRVGRRTVIALGWIVYAAIYLGFATITSLWPLVICFLIYGVYFGLTEGTEKALVADLVPVQRRGFAFGLYNAVVGIGALAASLLFGAIASLWGSPAAFATGAALALVASVWMMVAAPR
jgi:MFS family permease